MRNHSFIGDNHYVPCLSLRAFANDKGEVQVYRTLVSHANVPLWKSCPIRGVAYQQHLYTRVVAGKETDDIERWFHRDFETPAADPIRKAIVGDRLAPDDWHKMIRFVASQIVRTPAFYAKNIERWKKDTASTLESTLREAVDVATAAKKECKPLPKVESHYIDSLPVKLVAHPIAGTNQVALQAKAVIGRAFWIFTMKNLLSHTEKVLHGHRWTILHPADGLTWFTSDDPVVPLNYYREGRYDFGGGWGNKGTEILMPISPQHLLYTKIGERSWPRGTALPYKETQIVRRILAEHAFRMVIGNSAVEELEIVRPRIVDEVIYQNERSQWSTWREEQTNAEHALSD